MKIDIYNPGRCSAEGDGLTKATEGTESMFMVDTKGAGKGELNVLVEGKKDGLNICIFLNWHNSLWLHPGPEYVSGEAQFPATVPGSQTTACIRLAQGVVGTLNRGLSFNF